MSEQKGTMVVQKLDGTKLETPATAGESMATVIKRSGEFDPQKYSYMLAGKNVEGGQKQVDESLLDEIKVETNEQILIIPKTIAG